MFATSGAATVGWVAGGLGLAGLLVVLSLARRRTVTSYVLMAVYVALAAGGAILAGVVAGPLSLGLALVAAGAIGVCVAAASMTWRDGYLAQVAASARTAAGATKREIESLEAVRCGLEEQLRSSRRRVKELLAKAQEEVPVAPARIERYRERIRRLSANEEKLRQVIDTVHEGVVMLEPETLRLARFTPSVARMTCYEPDDLAERSLLDILEKGPSQPGRADLQRIAHERRPLAAKIVRADGTRLPIEISVAAVGKGEEAQLISVLRDVSEQARLLAQLDELRGQVAAAAQRLQDVQGERADDVHRLRALERDLEALRTAREQAVEAVAHDLRVPLTSVRSFSEILLRHEDADPHVQREFLEIIRKESERLTTLIDDLLDARRIRAGADEVERTDIDLRDVIGETLRALEGLAQERGVVFEGVWDRAERIVRGEAGSLRRMVENLLSNAVNFSCEGGSVEILLRDGGRAGASLLGIRDHGPGIPVEDQEIVFERFHRASVGPDQAPGSGLGLSICREIAAAHGASLWPESRGAGGTTMWVEFPPPGEADAIAVPAPGVAHGAVYTL